MITLDMQVKIAEWRQKCRDNTITTEEMQEAMRWLREDRTAAQTASKSKPGAAKKAAVSGDDLLKELDGL